MVGTGENMTVDAAGAGGDETTLACLRRRHPEITYEGFRYERREGELQVSFRFLLVPDIRFAPETSVAGLGPTLASTPPAVLENLLFHIGLIEVLSYWKAACCPRITIAAGALDAEQTAWFRELLLAGMGEYFFVNGIDFRVPDFVTIAATRSDCVVAAETGAIHARRASAAGGNGGGKPEYEAREGRRGVSAGGPEPAESRPSLLLMSGGKDSSVAVQLLKERGEAVRCLMLNPTPAALAVGAAAGDGAPVTLRRTIDPRLLALNAEGYLNGHTPFSALLAFWGVACAVLAGCGRVIVGNERSADEGNVEFLGRTINHQYTKSFAFEDSFRRYAARYLAADVSYFSLLRPLYDLQISRLFARYPEYFTAFRSCNRNQRENTWCGRCPKCVSTFIGLSPFVAPPDMVRIFGRDLYGDEAIMPLVRDLAGLGNHKPFECVGTRNETLAALYLAVAAARERGEALPPVLRRAEAEIFPACPDLPGLAAGMLTAWGGENHVPPAYAALLKERLGIAP